MALSERSSGILCCGQGFFFLSFFFLTQIRKFSLLETICTNEALLLGKIHSWPSAVFQVHTIPVLSPHCTLTNLPCISLDRDTELSFFPSLRICPFCQKVISEIFQRLGLRYLCSCVPLHNYFRPIVAVRLKV